jgi:hypothetical protein
MRGKNLINFTKEELYWIERSADIESSLLHMKFIDVVSNVKVKELTVEDKKIILKYTNELVEAIILLKGLRTKLEIVRNKK